MSTGDLNGNVQRLVRELRSIKYPGDVDEVGLRLGDPVALLPLLSFTLLKFSRHVARYIVRNGFELAGKTDQRFVETSFRLLRDLLNVRTVLTPAQFFEQGFAERKVLLLCDVITVCKKLHNDEVRHERLAALKATRQEQVISRLATPHGGQQEPPSGGRHAAGRRSPVVKVVRNDDVELLQVLAPTHQPNATDGAQSVFRTRKTISRSPSPSPPNAVTMRAGPDHSRSRMSPPGRRGASGASDVLELTLRPGSRGVGAPAGRPSSAAAAQQQQQQQPIHAWFLNPAFDEGVEGSLDLGLGLGGAGGARPDSTAWWQQSAPTPAVMQPAAARSWQQNPYLAFARASPTKAAPQAPPGGDRSGAGAPGAAAAAAWPAEEDMAQRDQSSSRQPHTRSQHHQQQQYHHHHDQRQQQQQPASSSGVPGGSAEVSGTAGRGGSYQPREIDEWSFSQYFGPGKGPQSQRTQQQQQQQQADGVGTSQDLGGADYGQGGYGHDQDAAEPSVAGSGEDEREGYTAAALSDRDGRQTDGGHAARRQQQQQQQSQQQQRGGHALFGWQRSQQPSAAEEQAARAGPSAAAAHAAAASTQQRPGVGAGLGRAAPAASEGAGHGGQDWAVKLRQLEQETQQQVQQLRERLAATEAELEKCRSEARQARETLQAQVTVLEGRVRFLECEMELCVKRQPTPARPAAAGDGFGDSALYGASGAAARASPGAGAGAGAGRAAGSPGREPSPAAAAAVAPSWRFGAAEPQRPHSAGGALQLAGGRPSLAAGATDAGVSTGANAWAGQQQAGQAASGLRGPAGSPPRASSAEPTSGAAAAAAALARASAEWLRPATSQPAPATGAAVALRFSAAAEPSLLTSSTYTTDQALQHQQLHHPHPQQPAPPAARLQPLAPQPASLVGSTGGRVTAGLTPMPQPSFSFQPSSLMQQVAASAAAAPGEGPAPAQELAPAPPQAHGQRLMSSSVDSGATAGRRHGAAGAAGALGAGGNQHVRGSAESALSSSSAAAVAAAAAAASRLEAGGAAGGAAAGVAAGHVPAWRAQPSERAGVTGGRLGTGGGAVGGSILDGISATAPAAAAASTAGLSASQSVPAPGTAPAPPAALAAPGGMYTLQPASAGQPGTGTGGSAGGGAYRSTDDLINSLYVRYTEAQDFLQSIRRR